MIENQQGISPNIGFVSELMNFEESELGGKSVGVIKDAATPSDSTYSSSSNNHAQSQKGMGGARRPAHVRESLPSGFTMGADAFELDEVDALGAGAETEVRLLFIFLVMGGRGWADGWWQIRDAQGRYRFARRAPVDAHTLQPSRRVSKAGLESGGWEVE